MPEMDGIQATKKIRKNLLYKDLPIVAMTAHAMAGDKEKSLNAGMNEHITKPINVDELYNVLTLWLKPLDFFVNKQPEDNKTDETTFLPDNSNSLNVDGGLQRLGGNKTLFNKLLKEFYQDHHNDIKQLQQAFDKKQFDDAKRIIHTLKGVTGNIGADKLQQFSSQLEQCIFAKQNYSMELKLFTQEFNLLMKELCPLDSIKPIKQKVETNVTDDQFRQHINKLFQLLNEGNIAATEVLSSLYADLHKNVPELTQDLQKTLENYEFEQAVQILDEISTLLNIAHE
jgi:polar amino acid transport system substrate-binding protein